MRIVLDTNVLARALSGPRGPAGELLRRVHSPHVLVLSFPLLDELARVLRYERLRRIHGLGDDLLNLFLVQLQSAGVVVDVAKGASHGVVAHDLDDDFLIATARAGNAEVICTLDRHLHRPNVVQYCEERGIRIMSDIELLQTLRGMENSEDG